MIFYVLYYSHSKKTEKTKRSDDICGITTDLYFYPVYLP